MLEPALLGAKLAASLPPELTAFLKRATSAASARGWGLYLVGGAVRDLLLGRPGLDLDLSVEGDAIALAHSLAAAPDELTVHHRFNTACLRVGEYRVDIARSREESYPRPGALPSVHPAPIDKDLFRRDFTINAMALSLGDDRGRLIDGYGGLDDLRRGVIRVLHPASFVDDATRMWRAVRYEQRLGFQIDAATLALIERDRTMLKMLTADRERYELECILAEAAPEQCFKRADELGLLATWHAALRGDDWLAATCRQARLETVDGLPGVYLALLAWRLPEADKEAFIARLRLTRHQARVVRDSGVLSGLVAELAAQKVAPSRVYSLLSGLTVEALEAARVAAPGAAGALGRFLADWRRVAPVLTGDDLEALGVKRGADMKRLLDELRDLRLDGKLFSRAEEEAHVRRRLAAD